MIKLRTNAEEEEEGEDDGRREEFVYIPNRFLISTYRF